MSARDRMIAAFAWGETGAGGLGLEHPVALGCATVRFRCVCVPCPVARSTRTRRERGPRRPERLVGCCWPLARLPGSGYISAARVPLIACGKGGRHGM
eukprot:541743-Prymnesium_polylepis.1